jgi:hypothetical protein
MNIYSTASQLGLANRLHLRGVSRVAYLGEPQLSTSRIVGVATGNLALSWCDRLGHSAGSDQALRRTRRPSPKAFDRRLPLRLMPVELFAHDPDNRDHSKRCDASRA